MDQLLTPNQVADLLQVSVRTVYENAKRLGGFYPAGIKVLRFKEGVIRGIMEGSAKRPLEVSVSSHGEAIRRRVGTRPGRKPGAPERKGESWSFRGM